MDSLRHEAAKVFIRISTLYSLYDLFVTIIQEVCLRNIFLQLKISANKAIVSSSLIVLQNRCGLVVLGQPQCA